MNRKLMGVLFCLSVFSFNVYAERSYEPERDNRSNHDGSHKSDTLNHQRNGDHKNQVRTQGGDYPNHELKQKNRELARENAILAKKNRAVEQHHKEINKNARVSHHYPKMHHHGHKKHQHTQIAHRDSWWHGTLNQTLISDEYGNCYKVQKHHGYAKLKEVRRRLCR